MTDYIFIQSSLLHLVCRSVRSVCIVALFFTLIDQFLVWKDPELFGHANINPRARGNKPASPPQIQILIIRLLLYGLGLTVGLLSFPL